MAINKDELSPLSPPALIFLSASHSRLLPPSALLTLFLKSPVASPHLSISLPSSQSALRFPSTLFSPSISLLLTQQSIMRWPLDAGLPLTLPFIRTLKSRNHSLLFSAGRCHLLRYPSHLADDQYEPFPSAPPPPLCSSFTTSSSSCSSISSWSFLWSSFIALCCSGPVSHLKESKDHC